MKIQDEAQEWLPEDLNVNQYFVWKLFNTNNLHLYHFRRVHAIYRNDPVYRMAFSEWALNNQNTNMDRLYAIRFI